MSIRRTDETIARKAWQCAVNTKDVQNAQTQDLWRRSKTHASDDSLKRIMMWFSHLIWLQKKLIFSFSPALRARNISRFSYRPMSCRLPKMKLLRLRNSRIVFERGAVMPSMMINSTGRTEVQRDNGKESRSLDTRQSVIALTSVFAIGQ